MNNLRLSLLALALSATALVTGCSYSGSLTTTQGSTAATLAAANPEIGQGAAVTDADTAAGTTLSSVSGVNLQLSLPATLSGMTTATFKNTPAFQFAYEQNGLVAYGQSLALELQTLLPQIAADANDVASLTQLVQTTTAAFGLTPATPSESSLYTKIVNGTKTASSDIGVLENFLTGLSVTGTPAPAATPAN